MPLLAISLALAIALALAPAPARSGAPASPVGFWALQSSTGDCEGLERASPEAHFTADGRYSFASRSYVLGGHGPNAGCCTVRWGRVGLWRAADGELRLDPLSIPAEVRARAPVESATVRSDSALEVRVPETSCTLAFARSNGMPDWRHTQTLERLRACVQVHVTKPGAGPPTAWGDTVEIEMRVRSPAVLASTRSERSTVEPGSLGTWATIEHAIVGHAVGARLRVTACPELTLAGVPPEQMPAEPIVADVRILSRAVAQPVGAR